MEILIAFYHGKGYILHSLTSGNPFRFADNAKQLDMTIAKNIERVRLEIAAACERSNRKSADVQVVAVSKTVAVPKIIEAIAAGVTIIGENRVQEAVEKSRSIHEPVSWHLIGHLQTNKVRRALEFAAVIETLDSLRLAAAIQQQAELLDRTIDVFVQVNTSGEETKFGLAPDQVGEFIGRLTAFDRVRVIGLMTIAQLVGDAEKARPSFQLLRKLRDSINSQRGNKSQIPFLSMGMTNDYTVAVEEGATHVRIGRAIFGER